MKPLYIPEILPQLVSNKQLHYIPVRGQDIKWMSFILQYIVMLYYSEYSSENEVKDGDNDTNYIFGKKGLDD